jgi:hypothetical protein
MLVIEIVDTPVDIDRPIKVPIYAREDITEVWIVNLVEDTVHTYAEPMDGAYLNVRTLRLGDVLVPTVIKGVEIPVSMILGKERPS